MRLESFPPIVDVGARVLVLGSMPGAESLRRGQYYAYRQNSFWWIAGELFGALPELDYEERTARLRAAGVALWDVLLHCERSGSLDASIARTSEVPNDFAALYAAHPGIETLFFNGRKAFDTYQCKVLPNLATDWQAKRCMLLPSTSPAHAALNREQKLEAWRTVRAALENPRLT